MDYLPFARDYPFGFGLMLAAIGSMLYAMATGTTSGEPITAAFTIGAWIGYQLKATEANEISDE